MRHHIILTAVTAALMAGGALAQTAQSQQGVVAPTATPPAPVNTNARPPFIVPFMRGGTSLNNDMELVIDRIVAYAQANRTMGVVVTGIANSQGVESSRASRARGMAISVRNYLRDRGVSETRSRIVAEGDAAVGAVNRVEVTFVPMR